jgi:hypothetical protein
MRPRHAIGAQRLPESVSPTLHSIAIRLRDFLSLNKRFARMYDDVRYLFQSSSGIDTVSYFRIAWAKAIKDSFDVLGRILWSTDKVVGAVDMCDSEAGTISGIPVSSVSCARQGIDRLSGVIALPFEITALQLQFACSPSR